MTEWRETTLGEVLTLQRGFDITKREQRPGRVPVVSSSGVSSYHDEPRVEAPGVVIGRKGSLGTVFFLEEPFWPHDTTLWVKDFKGNDPYFCHLLLRTLPLAELDAGSSNPTLNRNHAHTLGVGLPDPGVQRRIAAVLAAFDELMAINERRVELLEDVARSLYREWFVRLRFPGHERGAATRRALPTGWETARLGDVAELVMGQSPRSEFYNDAGVGLPFHQGVSDYGPLVPTHRKYSTQGPRQARAGDVLCSVRAPVGRLNLADRDLIVGRGLTAIRRRDGRTALLIEQLRHSLGEEDSIGGGTIFKAVGKDELSSLPVVESTTAVRAAFEDACRPMLNQRVALTLETLALARTRDLLLPRLVTGRLDIADIDLGDLLPAELAA